MISFVLVTYLGYGTMVNGPVFSKPDPCEAIGSAGYVEWGLILSKMHRKDKIDLGNYGYNCLPVDQTGKTIRSMLHPHRVLSYSGQGGLGDR